LFLICLIEKLFSGCEVILETFFRLDLQIDADDDLSFELFDADSSALEENKLSAVRTYLLNVRQMAAMYATVFLSQIKQLITERVIYDRELFNYEEYRSRGMNDDRLIWKTLFCKSGKTLMGEFFKFQK